MSRHHGHIPKRNIVNRFVLYSVILFLLNACGSSKDASDSDTDAMLSVEQRLSTILDAANTDTDFTLLVESNNGTQFVYRRGESTETNTYRSASTSKMVTATIILWLVEQGVLSLSDHPQDYLEFWPTTGLHADIELRHLLSFTSGLSNEPVCMNVGVANFSRCVETILEINPSITPPGEEYYYANTHLQVAGLMAIQASGLRDWEEVFDYFKTETQLFANAAFDLPSTSNPRLAGGMRWQAVEYVAFLSAIYHQRLLSPVLVEAMISDQIENARIGYSPVSGGDFSVDWHYGFGLWIECTAIAFNCSETTRVSSLGAYGAYPFIDFEQQHFGIVAREGDLGTGYEGYQLWTRIKNELAEWAGNRL